MIYVPHRSNSPVSSLSVASRVAVWLCSGVIGSVAVSSQAAWANPMLNDTSHFLVAQQVVDGLPPPPPGTTGQEAAQRYLVVVNGDNDMLLSQVQQVQPTASLQGYNGQSFIQAGMFNDLTSAQQQVLTLSASGIAAKVVSVTSASTTISQVPSSSLSDYSSQTTMPFDPAAGTLPPPEILPTTSVPSSPGEVEFGSTSSPSTAPDHSGAESGSRAFYVVIPGRSDSLEAVSSQIIRLTDGMGIDGMVQTGTSHGPHVRVGPFNSRSAANRWTRYFRDFGMDARVSYVR